MAITPRGHSSFGEKEKIYTNKEKYQTMWRKVGRIRRQFDAKANICRCANDRCK